VQTYTVSLKGRSQPQVSNKHGSVYCTFSCFHEQSVHGNILVICKQFCSFKYKYSQHHH